MAVPSTLPFSWQDLILPRLPGASPDIVSQQVLAVLRDFCAETWVWTEDLPPIDIKADTAFYPLIPSDTNAIVNRPITVHLNGEPLNALPVYERPSRRRGYIWHPDRRLQVLPTPATDRDQALTVFAVLEPRTFDVPAHIAEHWQETIAAGVLGRLMRNKGTPYSDPQNALLYLREYRNGINRARLSTAGMVAPVIPMAGRI